MIFWITGLLAVVAMYFIFRYLKTGKTTDANTDAPLFGLVVFTYSVILQYCLKSDSGASSIMANGITLTFIIVAFLDNAKDGGVFSGRILDKVIRNQGHARFC